MTTDNSSLDDHLNNTVGCVFVGILLELMYGDIHGPYTLFCVDDDLCSLYGFFIAQTQYYFHEYPYDRLYLQILVRFNDISMSASIRISSPHLWHHNRWHYYGEHLHQNRAFWFLPANLAQVARHCEDMLRSASKGAPHIHCLSLLTLTACTTQFLWSYLVTSHGNIDGMSRFTGYAAIPLT